MPKKKKKIKTKNVLEYARDFEGSVLAFTEEGTVVKAENQVEAAKILTLSCMEERKVGEILLQGVGMATIKDPYLLAYFEAAYKAAKLMNKKDEYVKEKKKDGSRDEILEDLKEALDEMFKER